MEDPTLADPFGLVGTLLERKIRVERVVAAGGFGVVYAGHHLGLDAPVAIKVLRPSASHGGSWGEAVAQFLNEAKTIAKLRHPAVVASLDAGIAHVALAAEGVPWIVLEWIDGETLQADLARRRGSGGRSREDALALLEPVIEAIAIAHDAGIAHRDLKPSNVMLARAADGSVRARVLDFGIAKLMEGDATTDAPSGETATQADARAFSAVCAAPEQISGTRTGPWTDVYALALMLTELVTDRAPYPQEDRTTLVAAVFDATRPTPAKLGVDVGPWEPVLAKALSVKPAERQPNARALLAELKGAKRDAKIETTLASPDLRGSGAPSPIVRESTTRREPPRARSDARKRGALVLAAASIGAIAIAWGVRAKHGATDAALRDERAAACVKNADCATDAATHAICRAGACVALETADCSVLADARALASDDTVWIGSLFPLTGEDAPSLGVANARALDVARRDFEQTMSGLASSRAGDAARSFGVVSCDDAVDARRAAAHLVDDVGVPAVVGFRSGVEAIDLATTVLLPKRVLSICATSTNPLVTRVPEPADEARLVWRTTDDGASTAVALEAFARGVFEPDARAHGEIARGAPMRVALVRPKDALGAAFADAYVAAITKSGAAIDEGAYRDLPYDFARDDDATFAPIARALLAYRPNLVLFFGGKPVVDRVLVPLESQWPKSLAWRPRYVSIAVLGSILLDFAGADADRRRRVFGVGPPSSTPANLRFVGRYKESFPDDPITKTTAPNTAYDAFYLLAYATYAIPRGDAVTGPALSRAFDRLRGGARIEAGLSGIFDGYRALASGGSIDLVGATGRLDLDRATGEPALDEALLCAAADASGRAVDGVESGWVYARGEGKLVTAGKPSCP